MEFNIDKKSKIVIVFAILGIIASITICYYLFLLKYDYLVFGKIKCDTKFGDCFKGIDSEDPYLLIAKKSYSIPPCGDDGNNCKEISCKVGEFGCSVITCNAQSLKEYNIESECLKSESNE